MNYAFVGTRIGSAPQFGTDRQALALWQVVPPLRLSTTLSGLERNGDIVASGAALTVYSCRSGAFDLLLLVKEPELVRIFVNHRLVRRTAFSMATTWRVRLEVAPSAAGNSRICELEVLPSGLLGTTRFEFER